MVAIKCVTCLINIMDQLSKKGDLRHVIDIPETEDVKAEPGNIFGVKRVGIIEEPEVAAQEAEPQTEDGTKKKRGMGAIFKALRMPFSFRLWGRS